MPAMIVPKKAIAVLLVENNTADVDLTREVLAENNDHLQLNAVRDGEPAPLFLHRRRSFSNREERVSAKGSGSPDLATH